MRTGSSQVHRAKALIAAVAAGDTARQVQLLTDQARVQPRKVAELAIELALMAGCVLAAVVGPEETADSDLRHQVAREAHRLHARGVRTGWVEWGQRLYMRDRKRAARSGTTEAPHDRWPVDPELITDTSVLAAVTAAIGADADLAAELRVQVLREAHRLHGRGVRTSWVEWGERLYQRYRKQAGRAVATPQTEAAS